MALMYGHVVDRLELEIAYLYALPPLAFKLPLPFRPFVLSATFPLYQFPFL